MLFITLSIRETVNSSTIPTEQLLRSAKLVTRIRDEITLSVLPMETQLLMEENLDLSIADLDQFKIHQATITQIRLI
tara:strand:+ start:524 stop:754 length:231 start_codon:yes stop_codon:yes gene_type:complete